MQYLGGKARLSKYLAPIINGARTCPDQWIVEPFCGGANMTCKLEGRRIASDINFNVMLMFRALQKGWLPPTTVSEEEFNMIKKEPEKFPPELVGFVSHCCSFAGHGLNKGYAHSKKMRNYALSGYNALVRQLQTLQDVLFLLSSYDDLCIPDNSIIYCDPPYMGCTGYGFGEFDHVKFWQWCREQKRNGHVIFISEYQAPEDFRCIFEKEITVSSMKMTGGESRPRRIERLFTL